MCSAPAVCRCSKGRSSSSLTWQRRLRLIAAQGPDVFYRGEIAPAIVAAQLGTANGGKPGLMTLEDLANYNIVIREPIVAEYRGYRIASMSPPSSGGLTMINALKMLERYPLGDIAAGFGFGKASTLHVMTEAMRLAFADRAVWMGDEDFVGAQARPDSPRLRRDALATYQPHRAHSGQRAVRRSVAVRTARAASGGAHHLAAAEPVSYPGG